jgi:hypothetical protein
VGRGGVLVPGEGEITFPTAEHVRNNAAHLGVRLSVPSDRDVVLATPSHRLTGDLRAGIKAHREELMRDLLLKQAVEYLSHRYVDGADMSVLDAPGEKVDEYHHRKDVPFGDFRKAVREYVMAGVNEFRRVRNDRH